MALTVVERALLLRHNELIMKLIMVCDNRDMHFHEREIRRELEAMAKMILRGGVTGTASDGTDNA